MTRPAPRRAAARALRLAATIPGLLIPGLLIPGLGLATSLRAGEGAGVPAIPGPQGVAPEVAGTLGVQFTDRLLRTPDWRAKVDLAARLGVRFVRVDLNWPWTETEPGRYDWSLYDGFAAALRARGMRPLFILNRPNGLHGRPYDARGLASREFGIAPPRDPADVAAFARWAAAAALHFRDAAPIWEIWNEPEERGFWPPVPDPAAYVALARETCAAIKRAVPGAFVTGPGASQMPTIYAAEKPLLAAVLRDAALARCLDAVSLHTHRFGQAPETVARDYAVYRRVFAGLPGLALPLLDTEWGDAVHRGGISAERQARWLPRMVLTNLVEGVRLTNWYCLFDVGDDDAEIEDRFGLVARDGRPRPAYRAYGVLARALRGLTLRQAIARFDVATAKGATVLLFCPAGRWGGRGPGERCKLAAWTTEGATEGATGKATEGAAGGAAPARTTIPGWVLAGRVTGHLGRALTPPPQAPSSVTLELSPDVQFADVRPADARPGNVRSTDGGTN